MKVIPEKIRSLLIPLTYLLFLLFSPYAYSAEVTISGQDNTTPLFSENPVNLFFEPNSTLNIINDDAVFIGGGSSVTLGSDAKISVTNSVSEGTGIRIFAVDGIGSNNTIHLKDGASIQVATKTADSNFIYSDMQGESFMSRWSEFDFNRYGTRLLLSDPLAEPDMLGSVSYDSWETTHAIADYMSYPNSVAIGVAVEGYDSAPQQGHRILLENATVTATASAHCWAEARGINVDTNSVVKLDLNNSHIIAETFPEGSDSCQELPYVYGSSEVELTTHNSTGVYVNSEMVINVDSTSSITGDWAVWGNPGMCVGWYHG